MASEVTKEWETISPVLGYEEARYHSKRCERPSAILSGLGFRILMMLMLVLD